MVNSTFFKAFAAAVLYSAVKQAVQKCVSETQSVEAIATRMN